MVVSAVGPGGVVRVLLVEDDPADAQLLRATLASSTVRFDLEQVTTLADATTRLGQPPAPDVVLLDLSLPDSTGTATLERLVAADSDVPVVVLTGLDDDRTAAEAVEAGAQDYLVKGSVTRAVVARAIRHAIERHRLLHTLHERVKEMAGLAAINRMLRADRPTVEVCGQLAAHLADAMQWPEICHADVRIDDATAAAGPGPAPDGTETLTAPIMVGGQDRGRITVGYTQPDRGFLVPEEQRLLDGAAEAVGGWLARQDALRQVVRDEERLRLLVFQLPGAIWTTDRDLRVTSEAGAALASLGGDVASRVGMPLVELLESTGPDGIEPFTAALAGESRVFVGAWRDGWWRYYVEPKRNADGDIVGIVCLTLDITAEIRQQAELDAAHDRFRGLFTSATDAMILADDDGTYIDANPAACDLTGYDRDELMRLHAWDLQAAPASGEPGTTEEAAAMWRQFLADGAMAGEFPIRRKDGRTVETDFRAVADIVPGVHLSTLRDITARKQAERALAASEEQFRSMADSAQDAIYRLRLEPEVAFDYVNPAVEALSGFPLQAFYDNPFLYQERAHPDDRDQLDPAGLLPGPLTTIRVRFQHADGHWVWLEDRRSAIVEGGRPVGAQGVIRDTTLRERTEGALRDALQAERQAAERLRAADELKSGFLQAVSHELRTPLTSLVGYTRTLIGRADQLTAEQTHHFHQRLAVNATRLDALLTDLLDVERLNRGVVRLDLEPTDLTALAARVAATIVFDDHSCVVDPTPATAVVDPRKVERIIYNLLANGVKHTPAGSTVWVRCTTTADVATITVSDNGPGIPEPDRDRLFDPFWQGQATQTAASPGTGVGLSIVHQFAALHGGRVWVGQRSGGGASFTVSLPTTVQPSRQLASADSIVLRTHGSDQDDERAFFALMQDTVDQLDASTRPDEATGIILTFLQRIGAELTDPTDPDSITIDLSIDHPQPLRPAAAHGTITRRRPETHLPFLLAHARGTVTRQTRPPGNLTDDDIDPATGILRPDALDRLLGQLHGHDALAVITIDVTDTTGPARSDPTPGRPRPTAQPPRRPGRPPRPPRTHPPAPRHPPRPRRRRPPTTRSRLARRPRQPRPPPQRHRRRHHRRRPTSTRTRTRTRQHPNPVTRNDHPTPSVTPREAHPGTNV